jgi:ornithine cyclodeaminase
MMTPPFYDAAAVERLLDYPGAIAAMRAAMLALSAAGKDQPLRQIVKVSPRMMFGVMPGDLAALDAFGAKLVSVGEDPARPGRSRHQGVVVSFNAQSGSVQALGDAEAITAIRTACSSAAATDALARKDARVLAIFGTGTQAEHHIRALAAIRPWSRILVWGRSGEAAAAMARSLSDELSLPVEAASDPVNAARAADVICTVSGAATPILLGAWVRPGTHLNVVGSSFLGPVEIDTPLVASARYIADYRPGVLAQGSELAVARAAGAVGDTHVVGEIGEVYAGTLPGRQHAEQITLYKSLGHVVQDLAALAYLHGRALAESCPA